MRIFQETAKLLSTNFWFFDILYNTLINLDLFFSQRKSSLQVCSHYNNFKLAFCKIEN